MGFYQIVCFLTIAFAESKVYDGDVIIVGACAVLKVADVVICLPIGTTNFTERLITILVRAVIRTCAFGLSILVKHTDLVEIALMFGAFSLGIYN